MQPAIDAPTIRIVLIEDDERFSAALMRAIGDVPDMLLLAHAATLSDGMRLLMQEPADVMLVDLGLPDGSGIALIHAARQRWPDCEVMALTLFSDEANVIQSIEAGASGYLLKDLSFQRIAEEIRSLHNGGSPISPRIARHILARLTNRDYIKPAAPHAPSQKDAMLSSRERQALDHIVKGHTYDEIGGMMGISRHTVRTFIRRIYAKFEVCSKIEAINKARELGIIRN